MIFEEIRRKGIVGAGDQTTLDDRGEFIIWNVILTTFKNNFNLKNILAVPVRTFGIHLKIYALKAVVQCGSWK